MEQQACFHFFLLIYEVRVTDIFITSWTEIIGSTCAA